MWLLLLGFIGAIFQLLTTITLTFLIVLILALFFAYATKPTNESFKKYLRTELTKQTQMKLASTIITKMLDTEIKDFVFFKVATINNYYGGKDDITFVGAFQTWGRL